MIAHEGDTGVDAVEHQRAEHDGRGGVSRDTKSQHGHHRTAVIGVVAAFRSQNTLGSAVAEPFGMLVPVLDRGVGHPGGTFRAHAGNRSDESPVQRPDTHAFPIIADFIQFRHGQGQLLTDKLLLSAYLLDVRKHHGHAEKTDQRRGKGNARVQFGNAEDKPCRAVIGILPDRSQQKSDEHPDKAPDNVAAYEGRNEHQPKHANDGDILRA